MKKSGAKGKSKKCLDKQTVAFALKRRARPRGKPFEKGNKIGNRFKAGISGNPGGRPKFTKISEAARAALALDPNEKVQPRTNAEAAVIAAITQAKRGNIGALTAIADRCEGRPTTSLSIEGEVDPMTELMKGIKELHLLYGPPEGMPKRNQAAIPEQKEQANEEN
jgi:hypothetical protein